MNQEDKSNDFVPLFVPDIRRDDMEAVISCMIDDELDAGKKTVALVKKMAKALRLAGGVALRDCVCAANVALELCGVRAGDSVALSPLAPAIYADILRRSNMTPRYIDVDIERGLPTHSDEALASLRGSGAIILDSTLGQLNDATAWRAAGVPIIVDLSSALGAEYDGRPAAEGCDYALIGLERDHIITGGGGAVLLASDNDAAETLRRRCASHYIQLSQMNAALAMRQLTFLRHFVHIRQKIGLSYYESLNETDYECLLPRNRGLFFSFPLRIDGGKKEIIAHARRVGVACEAAYQESIINSPELSPSEDELARLPNAKKMAITTLLFPLYPALIDSNIALVKDTLASLP